MVFIQALATAVVGTILILLCNHSDSFLGVAVIKYHKLWDLKMTEIYTIFKVIYLYG